MEPVQNPSPQIQNEPVVHNFKSASSFALNQKVYIILGVALIFGLLSGLALSKNKTGGALSGGNVSSGSLQKGAVFGSDDTKTFKDQAVGIMKQGGADGEGAYHLVRPGGDSQNVYLTSSLVDLSKFIDKKVKVWGATRGARVAGWLMDVGRVEVLE